MEHPILYPTTTQKYVNIWTTQGAKGLVRDISTLLSRDIQYQDFTIVAVLSGKINELLTVFSGGGQGDNRVKRDLPGSSKRLQ